MNNDGKRKLDRADIRILEVLQKQGRIPVTELSKQVNLTATPCSERLKRLEEEGYIDGYSARLNASKLGLTMSVWIMIQLDHTSMSVFAEFGEVVQDYGEIEECFLMTGEFDVMIKVRVKDMEGYHHFMRSRMPNLPGIVQTKSHVVIEDVKTSLGPSIHNISR